MLALWFEHKQLTCDSILNSTCPDSSSQSASTSTMFQVADPPGAMLATCVFTIEAVAIARTNCLLASLGPINTLKISFAVAKLVPCDPIGRPASNCQSTIKRCLASSGTSQ